MRGRISRDGAFYVTEEVPGAIKNGTRVKKVQIEEGDAHPIGARATILGSLSHPTRGIGYFVAWDDRPDVPVFVIARKVAEAEPNS